MGTISLATKYMVGLCQMYLEGRSTVSLYKNIRKEARLQKQVLGAELQKVFQSLTILLK